MTEMFSFLIEKLVDMSKNKFLQVLPFFRLVTNLFWKIPSALIKSCARLQLALQLHSLICIKIFRKNKFLLTLFRNS